MFILWPIWHVFENVKYYEMSKKIQNDIARVVGRRRKKKKKEKKKKKKDEEIKRVHRGSFQNLKRKNNQLTMKMAPLWNQYTMNLVIMGECAHLRNNSCKYETSRGNINPETLNLGYSLIF